MAKRRARSSVPTESLSAAATTRAIRSAGETWEAGETQLTSLPPEEQVAHLGLVVSEEELAAAAKAIAAANQMARFAAIAAPPAIDWRNNGGNFVPPVRDQKSC